MRLPALLFLLVCAAAVPAHGVPPDATPAPLTPDKPQVQGVFGYLPRVPADSPLPPYTILEVTDAFAFSAANGGEAAWMVVLSGHPVGRDCAEPDGTTRHEVCAVFTLARDGRVLSGRWQGAEPYAFRTETMRAETTLAHGWLGGTLRTVDDSQFTPDSAVVNVQFHLPCPGCD